MGDFFISSIPQSAQKNACFIVDMENISAIWSDINLVVNRQSSVLILVAEPQPVAILPTDIASALSLKWITTICPMIGEKRLQISVLVGKEQLLVNTIAIFQDWAKNSMSFPFTTSFT